MPAVLSVALGIACTGGTAPPADDAGGGGSGGGTGGSSTGGTFYSLGAKSTALPSQLSSHPPKCETLVPLESLPIHLFSTDGHEFYFEVSRKAAEAADQQACAGSETDPNFECPNFADNIRVVSADSGECADTGKVELDTRGGETFRKWLEIPTFKLDTGEFQKLKFAQGDSQFRLNNGQAGTSIVREPVALRIFKQLGYPAPSSSFVRTRSNIWDSAIREGVWAAHVLVQAYKKEFFEDRMPDAVDVWEGKGDPFSRDLAQDGWTKVDCQYSANSNCDADALQAIVSKVRKATSGAGFMKATEGVVDWPRLHENICISAMLDAGDDWAHSGNNVVLVRNEAGKVLYLPYSTDATGGFLAEGGEPTEYPGSAYLITSCFADPDCKAAALSTCDTLVDQFETLNIPTSVVDERCSALVDAKLARNGDSEVCDSLHTFYKDTPARMRTLLKAQK